MTRMDALPADFLRLSARLGQDPLLVQGPGGNTSLKRDSLLWIKASGTELADAETQPIFVPVHLTKARAEAHGAGDGTCLAAVADPVNRLRPSIETTFHALIEWPVVAHFHSVAAIVHGISPEGRREAQRKLADLPFDMIPYRKPGRPLTQRIAQTYQRPIQIWLLENHGIICAGPDVASVEALIDEVEARLAMPMLFQPTAPAIDPPEGFAWLPEANVLAQVDRLRALALGGSPYPDHVVFLGSGLPLFDPERSQPAAIIARKGVVASLSATPAQRAMARCLADVLSRVPPDWQIDMLSAEAEAELLNWDAEKYRQALAKRKAEA
ncbi:MAG: class II aldolase/adducin family protein [Beijerinckiaceae bacterium]|nr:class II aldolase/adducin family protein [Beijerinckiaceae bacterium]